MQYHCVIPDSTAFEGIKALLLEIPAGRRSSFFAVLKRLGAQGRGLLTFSMGVTPWRWICQSVMTACLCC